MAAHDADQPMPAVGLINATNRDQGKGKGNQTATVNAQGSSPSPAKRQSGNAGLHLSRIDFQHPIESHLNAIKHKTPSEKS
ncbi:hypothetical protein [Comamonas testosteroni]|uniref:hypothetical protein n=1 Tax=Comamonas testosteroni TaxID=285 RepID=UPI002E0F2947|nr:hypothetical protein U0024_15285 [Comamonas testosteroni]